MSENPTNGNTGQTENMDEMDKLIASLPTLHISEEMVDDVQFVPLRKPKRMKADITVIFAMIAWFFLIFALMTLSRSLPPRMDVFFRAFTGTVHTSHANTQYTLSTLIYLAGGFIVCAGGLGICALKKMKMSRGSALNFWIVGGVSVVTAALLLIS
jgi:hypothetical protein